MDLSLAAELSQHVAAVFVAAAAAIYKKQIRKKFALYKSFSKNSACSDLIDLIWKLNTKYVIWVGHHAWLSYKLY